MKVDLLIFIFILRFLKLLFIFFLIVKLFSEDLGIFDINGFKKYGVLIFIFDNKIGVG